MSERRVRTVSEIEALARELGPLARDEPAALQARVKALDLAEQAELALRLPAPARLELLLHAPRPMALVRALPDGEIYLTVREVGPLDALPLVSLASASQLQHLLDLESWSGDRFDAERAGAWVALLAEAGDPVVRRFLRSADDEVLGLLFRDWARASPLEIDHEEPVHGHGLTEAGDEHGFVSPDGAYRFSPRQAEHVPAVRRVAEVLFRDEPGRYRRVLWEGRFELPAEIEEAALRWRQSRLEEHGYPPRDEATSIYAPPGTAHPTPGPPSAVEPDGRLPTARGELARIAGRSAIARAADRMAVADRDALLQAIGALANKVLVADALDPGNPEAHHQALAKAVAYVGIALEARRARDDAATEEVLRDTPAVELFREGHDRASRLAARAHRLVREGWASRSPRALELLEGPIRSRLRGLLLPRPLFYDETAPGDAPYREFGNLAEIEESRAALEIAEVVGRALIDGLGARPAALEPGATMSALFLTALAWHAIEGILRPDPLPSEIASAFVSRFGHPRSASAGAGVAALDAFLESLGADLGLDPREAGLLRVFGRASLDRLEADCRGLGETTPISPVSVPSLVLAR